MGSEKNHSIVQLVLYIVAMVHGLHLYNECADWPGETQMSGKLQTTDRDLRYQYDDYHIKLLQLQSKLWKHYIWALYYKCKEPWSVKRYRQSPSNTLTIHTTRYHKPFQQITTKLQSYHEVKLKAHTKPFTNTLLVESCPV